MRKYLRYIFIIGLILTVNSCDFLDHTKKYVQINSNVELDFTVNQIESKNGFILNNEFYYGGGVYLQTNKKFPKWISEEISIDDGTAIFSDDGQILLDIWKIKTPFQIYKKSNSNILNLIKNNDTLQFRIY
ncbi:major tail protein [Flavobacterium solisilvae]|mgnify:CR=1 FL=1|uniref:Uncharacterized protein n=1 Tax=Flavobacterium solisilvae TaxID=1852019 RepID=A0ABX1QSC6_9FLAO|nr:hypothetical protein [Flavobacterium solisilvae]NMH23925.1 hypothetical protein [Flavobacterium solisilvae]